MKCPRCGSAVTRFNKQTGSFIERCEVCNAKFKFNYGRKTIAALVVFFILSFVLDIFDAGLLISLFILTPCIVLSVLWINKLDLDDNANDDKFS